MRWPVALAALSLAGVCASVQAQQVPDRQYQAPVVKPAFAAGAGPMVCVDEAHRNFHTLGDKFYAFGQLVLADGYRVRPGTGKFGAGLLRDCAVLVISNAAPAPEGGLTELPHPTPAAFTPQEIAAVHDWVKDGGALLLIADHMPFAGAAASLAGAFDVQFTDGFAMRDPESEAPDDFRLADRSLRDHAITRGRNQAEAVASVRTFTGQAFRAPGAEPLLVFPNGYVQLLPTKPWEFTASTPRVPIGGWLQGAVMPVGKGRAAFFGEAAMFSAQLVSSDREPVGMNTPGAEGNFQFALNLLHWLTRTL